MNNGPRQRRFFRYRQMTSERIGVLAAILSSALGGIAAAATRFVIGAVDPATLAAFRFGGGFVLLLPLALLARHRGAPARSHWPHGRDWIGTALLGLMFFAVFFIVYNLALADTSAARGALALSTLPLVTMIVAALLGAERMTVRKTVGVLVAMSGVALALLTGLAAAPASAWRGDLIMLAATLIMALYSVWSRPFMARSSPLGFVTASMGFGGGCLVAFAAATDGFAAARGFGPGQWAAVTYLAVGGGAAAFYLWNFALERTTPTRVTNTMTVNPLAASIVAAIVLGEPIGLNLIVGLMAVGVGIWIASSEGRPFASAKGDN
jgi:drug/metabolite transporter (DMT)-like permease